MWDNLHNEHSVSDPLHRTRFVNSFKDRFMNIAKAGHDWSPAKFEKYPDLKKHLSAQLNKNNMIFRYPKPVEKPLTWSEIKGFGKH